MWAGLGVWGSHRLRKGLCFILYLEYLHSPRQIAHWTNNCCSQQPTWASALSRKRGPHWATSNSHFQGPDQRLFLCGLFLVVPTTGLWGQRGFYVLSAWSLSSWRNRYWRLSTEGRITPPTPRPARPHGQTAYRSGLCGPWSKLTFFKLTANIKTFYIKFQFLGFSAKIRSSTGRRSLPELFWIRI